MPCAKANIEIGLHVCKVCLLKQPEFSNNQGAYWLSGSVYKLLESKKLPC